MDQPLIIIAAIVAIAFASKVHAASFDELMTRAIRDGSASGELTGKVADRIKAATHSKEKTLAKAERISSEPDGCHFFKFTITQPGVPNTEGKVIGDYKTVTKSKFCADDRKEQHQPEVIECSVGGVSCMPQAKSTATPTPRTSDGKQRQSKN